MTEQLFSQWQSPTVSLISLLIMELAYHYNPISSASLFYSSTLILKVYCLRSALSEKDSRERERERKKASTEGRGERAELPVLRR